MEKRVAITGAGGLFGQAFLRAFGEEPGWTLLPFHRADMNLGDREMVSKVLEAVEFDVLVHAAAYTAVDDCEVQRDLARSINGDAPGQLARICKEKNAQMILISTDYVFDGEATEPYREDARALPASVYGWSKLIGEEQVLEADPRHLVARLSWLFGPGRRAFPEWIINQAQQTDQVDVVADKWSSPSYTPHVMEWLRPLISGEVRLEGILHLCNSGVCSWLEYGQQVLDCAREEGIDLRTLQASPVPMDSLAGLAAPRPPYSALDTGKFQQATGIVPAPWKEAVRQHIQATASHFR